MESSIKTLTITGGAAQVKAPRRPASKQTTRRRGQQFENDTEIDNDNNNDMGQDGGYENTNASASLRPIVNTPTNEVQRLQVPRVQIPKAQIPRVQIPRVQIPQANIPQANISQANIPQANISQANIPQANIPQINLLPKYSVNQHVNKSAQEPEKITKVILNPAKPRVKLNPPKSATVFAAKSQTRKARRIHLTTSSLTHRFTRAKKLTDEAEQKPVENIREYLIKRGVIQEKSKAPVKMLKSMYNDLNLLKDGQAL